MNITPQQHRRRVFDWAAEQGFRQVRLVIYQPKVYDGPRETTITLDELHEFARGLQLKAQRTREAANKYPVMPIAEWRQEFLHPDPNEEDCAFCRAQAGCPAVIGKLQAAAGKDFDVIAEDGTAPAVPEVPLTLSQAMSVAGLMEDWIKAVRAEVERQLLAGGKVDGWGLELGRQGNREWDDPEEVERVVRHVYRVAKDLAYNFKLKSPTQMEVLTKPIVEEDGTKRPAPLGPDRWARLTKMVTRADPKPSVRPASRIKTPYVVPALSTQGFEATTDPEEDMA